MPDVVNLAFRCSSEHNNIIQVLRCELSLYCERYDAHCSMECPRYFFLFQSHSFKIKLSVMKCECSFIWIRSLNHYLQIFIVCVQCLEFGGFPKWVDALVYAEKGDCNPLCAIGFSLRLSVQNHKVPSFFGAKTMGETHSVLADLTMLSIRNFSNSTF